MFGAAIQIRDSAPTMTCRHAISLPSGDQAGLKIDPATRAGHACAPVAAASAKIAMTKATPWLTGNIEAYDDRSAAAQPGLHPASGGTASLGLRLEHVRHHGPAARTRGQPFRGRG